MARFLGETFDDQKADFSSKYYRIVRIHCGKQVKEEYACRIISEWVSACTSELPIIEYDSPVLSAVVAGNEQDSNSQEELDSSGVGDSIRDSFQSYESISDLDCVDGWAPSDADDD